MNVYLRYAYPLGLVALVVGWLVSALLQIGR
jgi:hypothetical protein